MANVLVVDDDVVTCELVREVLERDDVHVLGETDPYRALERTASTSLDLLLVDVQMDGMNGLELLRRVRALESAPPVVIMTAFGSLESAAAAIDAGAVDYLSKPMNVEEIRAVVRRVLTRGDERATPLPEGGGDVDGLIGRSPAMVEVYKAIARVASGRSTVLIRGESGTGKELVARAIHDHSARRDRRFVAVDCGALSEGLLESELFGHVRGAYTGAIAPAPGIFVEADHGTIFLDEIGNVPPALQVKLLRVLQEQEIRPVGGSTWRSVDVRVIAATNGDIEADVASGQFREDLYYRLRVVTISLPPLRERADDIPLLVAHLGRRAAASVGKEFVGLSEDALRLLQTYRWPGNVRELAHVLERAVALARQPVLGVDDVLPHDPRSAPAERIVEDADAPTPTLEELKRRHVHRVLLENAGNVSRAARILGVDRRSLYRMLQRWAITTGPDEGE